MRRRKARDPEPVESADPLDLNTASETSRLLREIVLTISVTAKVGETTAFLVEVKQAGAVRRAQPRRGGLPSRQSPASRRTCVVPARARGGVAAGLARRASFADAAATGQSPTRWPRARSPMRSRRRSNAELSWQPRRDRLARPGAGQHGNTGHRAAAGRGARCRVLGAPALAIQFARAGHRRGSGARSRSGGIAWRASAVTRLTCPRATFPDSLRVGFARRRARRRATWVAVPSHALRATLTELRPRLRGTCAAWATRASSSTPAAAAPGGACARRRRADRGAVRPPPSRAVGAGLPTAMVVASPDARASRPRSPALLVQNFAPAPRPTSPASRVGGGPNVMAVGAGRSDGLGFGANTRIALITRASSR